MKRRAAIQYLNVDEKKDILKEKSNGKFSSPNQSDQRG